MIEIQHRGLENKHGIYTIKNLINDKKYIGSAINLASRLRVHKHLLNQNKHKNKHLQNAWNKYGKSCFIFEIVELVDDKNELLNIEQKYINFNESFKREKGYNLNKKAESNLGVKFGKQSKEHIKKRLEAKKDFKHSEETKKLMSESAKKRGITGCCIKGRKKPKRTAIHNLNQSLARKGKSWSQARRDAQNNRSKN